MGLDVQMAAAEKFGKRTALCSVL